MFLSSPLLYCLLRLSNSSIREKKAQGLEQHKKLEREKAQERKEKKRFHCRQNMLKAKSNSFACRACGELLYYILIEP
jgi:hypothetical protein